MQDLCHTLKEEYDIGASFYLVGSGAKNLIMQNANRPIDLDYNLGITRIDNWKDCRNIKECVRKAFNTVLRKHGWNDCEDSTSSLTTEKRCFTQGNDTNFSIDVCIVCEDVDGNYHRLIHEKTGFSHYDTGVMNQEIGLSIGSARLEQYKNGRPPLPERIRRWGRPFNSLDDLSPTLI